MKKIQRVLERAGPRPERFEAEAVRELEEAYRLRKTAVRASKAGIRAVKRGNAQAVEHEKARIQDCVQKVQSLGLVPTWRRGEFTDQMAAELVELAAFEWLYPYVFFGNEVSVPEVFSAEKLGVSIQAWYYGLTDVPGELGKAVVRFRRGRLSLEEKVSLRERLLEVIQEIISYLSDATDENVFGITGHEKDYNRRFEGRVGKIGGLINRLNEEMIGIQGQIQFVKEVRLASGRPPDGEFPG